jgi:hypothetical protein
MFYQIEEVKFTNPDYHQVVHQNRKYFNRFNGYRNNCSNTVKTFLSLLGLETEYLTAWADTIRNLGPVQYDPSRLKVGDIVAMGRPGDTHHVGVYLGNGEVLHQSTVRGYVVGVYKDLRAFINHRAGFYFVRPNYALREFLEGQYYTFQIS